jgi:hypothetical protein
MILETIAPVADRSLGFTVAARNVRGRVVRLDASLNAVLAAHRYPDAIARLLAEALVLTTMLGSTLQDGAGQMTMQAQAKGGAVDLLVCDYRAGAVRGYIRFDDSATIPAGMSLPGLFGTGHLAITLDPTSGTERYQGIVPLEGASLSDAVRGYFETSEQLPTLVHVAVSGDAATGWIAGGLLGQRRAARPSGLGTCPGAGQHRPRCRAHRPGAVGGDFAVAAVPRGAGPHRRRHRPDPRLPLLRRPYPRRARAFLGRGPGGNARRRRPGEGRLRILRPDVRGGDLAASPAAKPWPLMRRS